jgi:ParB family chromosome partitioning protein
MATKKTGENPEFLYLPLGNIIVEEQIRSSIDTTSESFKALMESIKDKGVLEPVLVTQKDSSYLLLCGERRYLAAQKLGLESIPARVINAVTQKDEILAIQLMENLQREDLNPIDQAKGILAFFQAKHPDVVYNLDGVINELMNYNLKPDSVSKEVTDTVSVIVKISAKSTKTVLRTISLLKLVPKIQEAIVTEKLPVSQGYLFAANLGSPDFFIIFDEIMETPVTNAKLEKMLTAYKRRKPGPTNQKPMPMKKKVAVLQNAKSYFEKKAGMYATPELQTFIDELKNLLSFMEEQVQKASETPPVKKPLKGPMI